MFILIIQFTFVSDLTMTTMYFTFFRCPKFTSYVQTRRPSWKKYKITSTRTSSTTTCGSCHARVTTAATRTILRGVGCCYGASPPWCSSITLWYFRGTALFQVKYLSQEKNIILLVRIPYNRKPSSQPCLECHAPPLLTLRDDQNKK